MNPDTVRKERRGGVNIIYGDAMNEAILEHANIRKARVLVVAIPDYIGTRAVVGAAKRIKPGIFIIVRTHYFKEMKPLYQLGADEVIPEEFETSIEIFTSVLVKYFIPRNEIDRFISKVRADGYEMLRSVIKPSLSVSDLQQHMAGVSINTFHIREGSPLLGKSLNELKLRHNYGINILAILRGADRITNPDSRVELKLDDRIIVFGTPEELFNFSVFMR
jgi:CPA2 family monovalent cation:H+ antiporter-2